MIIFRILGPNMDFQDQVCEQILIYFERYRHDRFQLSNGNSRLRNQYFVLNLDMLIRRSVELLYLVLLHRMHMQRAKLLQDLYLRDQHTLIN